MYIRLISHYKVQPYFPAYFSACAIISSSLLISCEVTLVSIVLLIPSPLLKMNSWLSLSIEWSCASAFVMGRSHSFLDESSRPVPYFELRPLGPSETYRIPPDREPEPPKADLNSGRREAMEEQMMATLTSIWDHRRTWMECVSKWYWFEEFSHHVPRLCRTQGLCS